MSVIDSLRVFGDIAARDSAYTGADGFEFQVSDTCTNGHSLRFALRCEDSRDTVWTSTFNLTVGTAAMSYIGQRVYDPSPGGNGNGRIDAGETAQLFATLQNLGLGHGYNVRAVLRSGDTRLQVTDSVGVYGLVSRDSSRENTTDQFEVHADIGIPRGSTLSCTLIVVADGGYETAIPVPVEVGATQTYDPIPDNASPSRYWAYDESDLEYNQHPDFDWVETRGRGTQVSLSDDQTVTVNLPSGFNWKYYGQNYSQVSICGNGWVAPGSTSYNAFYNSGLPSIDIPGAIALNWDDLYPPVGGGVWYFHDAANHRFVIEYDSVAYYSPQTEFDKFELVLYDTTVPCPTGDNVIVAQYLTANNYTANTIGLQDPGVTIAIQCLLDGAYHRGCAPMVPRRAIKYMAGDPNLAVSEPQARGALPRVRAFPNPFTSRLNLTVASPGAGPVLVGIYDNAGRLVRTLTQNPGAPGPLSFTWDARDAKGAVVTPGVYFYRVLTQGIESSSGKVVRSH